ncbi:MAG: hypothetical protein DMG17_29465 [Acidobacteria bacterium]|nr:MAG: hypothetical protein DMG17_29465 [Acidobacteriota bacterium]
MAIVRVFIVSVGRSSTTELAFGNCGEHCDYGKAGPRKSLNQNRHDVNVAMRVGISETTDRID